MTPDDGVDERDLLKAENISVKYVTPRGTVTAVDDASFSLRESECLGIVGETGSGKTVLTRRVMGLVGPGRNTELAGSVQLRGVDLTKLGAKELRRYWGKQIAVVLQDPMSSLNPVRRIGGQLTESVRHNLKLPRRQSRDLAVELFRSVGLPDPERQVRRYPHELSGGMRQRVAIAIALAAEPRILLADEPTTALDITVATRILDLLGLKRERSGMAMILVSHDLRVVQGRTDRVVVMYAGQIVETARTPALFAQPMVPYTRALMDAVPPRSGPNHVRLRVVPGRAPDPIDPPEGCRFSARCAYAQEKCVEHTPPLRNSGDAEHAFRCWFPLGSPESAIAAERNLDRGSTVAGLSVARELGPI